MPPLGSKGGLDVAPAVRVAEAAWLYRRDPLLPQSLDLTVLAVELFRRHGRSCAARRSLVTVATEKHEMQGIHVVVPAFVMDLLAGLPASGAPSPVALDDELANTGRDPVLARGVALTPDGVLQAGVAEQQAEPALARHAAGRDKLTRFSNGSSDLLTCHTTEELASAAVGHKCDIAVRAVVGGERSPRRISAQRTAVASTASILPLGHLPMMPVERCGSPAWAPRPSLRPPGSVGCSGQRMERI